MKIDSNKSNHQIPKDKSSQISNTLEKHPQMLMDKALNSNTMLQTKDFASVLKSTSRQKDLSTEEKKNEKSSENEKTNTEETELNKDSKETKNVRDEKRENSESDQDSDSNQDKSFGNFHFTNSQKLNEISIPSARAILHIADLERIISSIRANNVATGKQITIELKRSIFQGLELKLTIGKDKGVIAEFITSDENVKNQLNAKATEIAGILRDRGIKLTKLEMTFNSQSNDRQQNSQKEQISIQSSGSIKSTSIGDENLIGNVNDSNTSYQI